MQLTKRLQAVADLVTPGNRVADIGCDHAYIAIYLAERQLSPHILAMDVNKGPIDRAKANIIKYGQQDRIDLRKSDGLEKLEENEADTILIAGMGGALTIQILTARMEVVNTVKELVLQPQSEIYLVRELLKERGFLIISEDMVREDGKYYVMMKAVPGKLIADNQPYELKKKEHFYFGRLLLEQRHPVLKEYLLRELGLCEKINQELIAEPTDNSMTRQKEILKKAEMITVSLRYYIEGEGTNEN
jgi:tRNA (adenine22-N1)-methyltransferase